MRRTWLKVAKKNRFVWRSAIVLLLVGMGCLVFGAEEKKAMQLQKKMDFYGQVLPVFKCGLHTHSTVSDGSFKPEEVIQKYARAGYDVLAFTDHRKPNPVSTYDGQGMTLISGMEIHPRGPRGLTWHLLALGIPEDFPGKYSTGQEAVDAVIGAGGIVYCAHPCWSTFSSHDILGLKGLTGIEVYNTNCKFIGRENSEECWYELIGAGWLCPALAVDDMHTDCDLFGGWTMVIAPDRKPASIVKALKEGRCYATQGPEFTRLAWKDGVFEAEFSEAEEVLLLGCPGGEIVGTPGFPTPETKPRLTRCSYRPGPGFRGSIRCRIRDSQKRYAWTAPIAIDPPGTKKKER